MRDLFLAAAVAALASLLATPAAADAHGSGGSVADFGGDWAAYHMSEEHHLSSFDPGSFFTLHDFGEQESWSPADVRRLYGLEHEAMHDVPQAKREEVTREVFKLFDLDHNGVIERTEFLAAHDKGAKLPDFGLGPGHHGDDEYEYEIHHFEQYHDEYTKLEDLIHPEDIAHFAKHDAEDAEAERIEKQNAQAVIDENIPAKFRRGRYRWEL